MNTHAVTDVGFLDELEIATTNAAQLFSVSRLAHAFEEPFGVGIEKIFGGGVVGVVKVACIRPARLLISLRC